MKNLTKRFEIETDATIFSRGAERKVIVIFSPPDRLGFRLLGDNQIYWLTAAACYDVAVKSKGRFEPRFNVQELIEKAKKEGNDILPFQ
jgi:hypothetical protein